MPRIIRRRSGRLLVGAGAALAAGALSVGALSAGALAAPSYAVRLQVPSSSNPPGPSAPYKIRAFGVSAARSRLTVFVTADACATTAKAESARSAQMIITKNVLHSYRAFRTWRSKSAGAYRACAYLSPVGRLTVTRARAAREYYVLIGGY